MRLYRETYRVGGYKIIYEEYTRPPGTINRFATLIISSFLGQQQIRFRKYFRKGASILYDTRTGSVHAVCIEYISRYPGGTALCLGEPQYIEYILDTRHIYAVFTPASTHIHHCVQERIISRRRGNPLRLCIRTK